MSVRGGGEWRDREPLSILTLSQGRKNLGFVSDQNEGDSEGDAAMGIRLAFDVECDHQSRVSVAMVH